MYSDAVGGMGVRVHGGRVRDGVTGVTLGVFVQRGVGVSEGVGVPVIIGVKVIVGVLVSVGVYVAGKVGRGAPVRAGGLNGLIATRGLMKINNCPIHTITIKTATTKVAI
jgi:hypothetical protein